MDPVPPSYVSRWKPLFDTQQPGALFELLRAGQKACMPWGVDAQI